MLGAASLIKDFQPGYNGNWDSIITHAMIDMGVFLDDQAIFDRAVEYYKYGPGNGSLPNYVRTDGTTQETSRDCEHETMGIAGLIGTAQTASHQGVDLYGFLDNRLLIGVEGVASRAYQCGPMPNTELVRSKPRVLPNPFKPRATLHFEVPSQMQVSIRIYRWPVASGVYLARMPAANFSTTTRLTLIR